MKVALVIFQVTPDHDANLAEMVSQAERAAQAGASLVLFPEAAPTGLRNNGDSLHDLPLGRPVPGPLTEQLGRVARAYGVHIGSGLLERDGNRLYDAAVLLGASGEILIKYRRIQPQWHGKNADPEVYRQGNDVMTAVTSFGKVGFLICGDLFDDKIVADLCTLAPDYVLFPFARCFRSGAFDQDLWDREEEAEYVRRAALLHCTVLMVNQLEDPSLSKCPCFGGALIVSGSGSVAKRWPLARTGILYADV